MDFYIPKPSTYWDWTFDLSQAFPLVALAQKITIVIDFKKRKRCPSTTLVSKKQKKLTYPENVNIAS